MNQTDPLDAIRRIVEQVLIKGQTRDYDTPDLDSFVEAINAEIAKAVQSESAFVASEMQSLAVKSGVDPRKAKSWEVQALRKIAELTKRRQE